MIHRLSWVPGPMYARHTMRSMLPRHLVAIHYLPMSQTTKVCTICGEPKPVADYYTYVDARGVSRYRTECKEVTCKAARKQRIENGK